MQKPSIITIRFSGKDMFEVQEAIISLAHKLQDPDQIAAIRQGERFVDVELVSHPLDPKRLH